MKFLCGTPYENCKGANTGYTNGMSGKRMKSHGSPEEAFNCYHRYLVNVEKCVPVGQRELETPEGTTLVLNKKSKFGAKMRKGKAGQGLTKTNRYVPAKSGKSSNNLGGIIL